MKDQNTKNLIELLTEMVENIDGFIRVNNESLKRREK